MPYQPVVTWRMRWMCAVDATKDYAIRLWHIIGWNVKWNWR